jgi:hypothetical protein
MNMTYKEWKKKYDKAGRRLREMGIPDEKPLFFGSGRGRAFGRKPYRSYSPPSPPKPTPNQPDESAKQE